MFIWVMNMPLELLTKFAKCLILDTSDKERKYNCKIHVKEPLLETLQVKTKDDF